MFEVPQLRIQQIEGRYVAVYGDEEIRLPTPARLKEDAEDVSRSEGDDVAAEALLVCELSYAVAQGPGIEQFIQVVVAAPAGVFEALQEDHSPLTRQIMGALMTLCPDLGSDRVVRKE